MKREKNKNMLYVSENSWFNTLPLSLLIIFLPIFFFPLYVFLAFFWISSSSSFKSFPLRNHLKEGCLPVSSFQVLYQYLYHLIHSQDLHLHPQKKKILRTGKRIFTIFWLEQNDILAIKHFQIYFWDHKPFRFWTVYLSSWKNKVNQHCVSPNFQKKN